MFFFAFCFGGMANKLALSAKDSKGESPQNCLNVHTTLTTVLRIWELCGMVFRFRDWMALMMVTLVADHGIMVLSLRSLRTQLMVFCWL